MGSKDGEYFLLDFEEVIAFRDGELVWIITTQKRFLANQTLQEHATAVGKPRSRTRYIV